MIRRISHREGPQRSTGKTAAASSNFIDKVMHQDSDSNEAGVDRVMAFPPVERRIAQIRKARQYASAFRRAALFIRRPLAGDFAIRDDGMTNFANSAAGRVGRIPMR